MKRKCFKLTGGERFGRLTYLGLTEMRSIGRQGLLRRFVLVRCDCGTEKFTAFLGVQNGSTTSCGCVRSETCAKRNFRHGQSNHKLYPVWNAMRERCEKPSHPGYHNYGGRGITLCREWHTFKTFFDWCMTNGYKEGLEIDRRDNNRGYSPDNCRFVTPGDNQRNKRTNRYLTAFGETKTLTEWLEDDRCAISSCCLWHRLKRGFPVEMSIAHGGMLTKKALRELSLPKDT